MIRDRLYTVLLLVLALPLTYICVAVALGFVWAGSFTGAPPFAAAAYLICVIVLPVVAARRAQRATRLRTGAQWLLMINAAVLPFALLALAI